MVKGQLDLFPLGPRDGGQIKVQWSKGGIKQLQFERFKRFESFSVDFDRMTLLVGTNSSGKTSVLQAIRLFFWCISTCSRVKNDALTFSKAVIPFSDFHLIPAHRIHELAFRGKSPNSRARGIVLRGVLESGLSLSFRIYASYSTLMVIDPIEQPSDPLSEEQLSNIKRPPLYIPGFFGVVTRELLTHDARLEELLNSGHHNEVLRNIFLRLKQNQDKFRRLMKIMQDEFHITNMDLPFSDKETEFLRAEYYEPSNRTPLDFVSAGSGFLQVLQIMVHALQNPSPVLLLDEPDAHMHHALQRSFLRVLKNFVLEESSQVIMASHSETFLRESSLQEIRVIDPTLQQAGKFATEIDLQEELSETGIWPSHLELAEILRTKRVLLLEGEVDERLLNCIGRIRYKNWDSRSKLIQIVYSNGSSSSTVQRLEYIRVILDRLIPGGVNVAHMRDRDLLCDNAVKSLRKESSQQKLNLFILDRRNSESLLIEPRIVAKALRTKYKSNLPSELNTSEKVNKFVTNIIMEWCDEERDVMPVKVREYNLSWIKNYPQEEWHQLEMQLASFTRKNWQEPISSGSIPWKLVDGKIILRRIRQKLQSLNIILPEIELTTSMKESDFDAEMRKAVKLVYSWCK
jgi:predicted ATP-dependent endonuclease of OLD family